jgi:hypothetical protein
VGMRGKGTTSTSVIDTGTPEPPMPEARVPLDCFRTISSVMEFHASQFGHLPDQRVEE